MPAHATQPREWSPEVGYSKEEWDSRERRQEIEKWVWRSREGRVRRQIEELGFMFVKIRAHGSRDAQSLWDTYVVLTEPIQGARVVGGPLNLDAAEQWAEGACFMQRLPDAVVARKAMTAAWLAGAHAMEAQHEEAAHAQ